MVPYIKAAGDYLLSVLKDEKEVAYSRFYNADAGTGAALAEAVWPFLEAQAVEERGELGEYEKETVLEEAHVHLDWAAWQLADLGVVKLVMLEGTELIDGEPDFRIELTERGLRFIEEGESFGYRRPNEVAFDVREASNWLINLLDAGGPDDTLTLRDVMDTGDSDGEVAVTDDWGNDYPLGSNTYAWAFEVCLCHHARSGHIEPVFEDDVHRRAWEEHLRHQHLPPRPESGIDRPLWVVPFRLAEGVDPDHVQHVGSIGG